MFLSTINELYGNKRILSCERITLNHYNITEILLASNPIVADSISVDIDNNKFRTSNRDFNPLIRIYTSASFHKTIKKIPQWKHTLLQNIYSRYPTCLLIAIQQSQPLLVATDRSRSDFKGGGPWVISAPNGRLLAHGTNLDFGCMSNMYSHRSEAYAILSVLLFLHEYSKYFSLPIINKFTICYENKEIVTKVENIRINAKYYDLNYNMLEHKAIIAIKT